MSMRNPTVDAASTSKSHLSSRKRPQEIRISDYGSSNAKNVAALKNGCGSRLATRCTKTRNALGAVGCFGLVPVVLLALAGCPSSGPTGPDDDPNGARIAREIEEADIIKLQEGFLYVANPFTGLRIIDARDMDSPELLGRVELGGRTVAGSRLMC